MNKAHSFHIPVMGIGFTIDTPIKVAHLGIDSVISLVDDELIEKMRAFYAEKFQQPYQEIKTEIDDFRAKRITSYLELVNKIVDDKFAKIKDVASNSLTSLEAYFELLPKDSKLKEQFAVFVSSKPSVDSLKNWLHNNLYKGSIDVNIMTKVDKQNFKGDEKLPTTHNDAHAALRGFANSNLEASVVLSAGLNPRLYGYMASFEDFFPDENGNIKKKIILKVSDYRSALVQSQFLAKKGLWVSEFRIESGLNCGGHAFATEGLLVGPILEKFNAEKANLSATLQRIYIQALERSGKTIPKEVLPILISAQGGVGTAEEHQFLLQHYKVDSIGWGSPFLLVPEATTVDEATRIKLERAQEKDIYLSDISPLGIPFNNLRSNTKDQEKRVNIEKGRPGSSCPKNYVSLNTEFDPKGLCTASRKYQYLKLKELDTMNLQTQVYQKEFNKITNKSCTCVGLGTSALLANNLSTKKEGSGVSVCPGPNMAYFSESLSLQQMVAHIYGELNVLSEKERPHMFLKEFKIYLEYLKNKVYETENITQEKVKKGLQNFVVNMSDAIAYYEEVFEEAKEYFSSSKKKILSDFKVLKKEVSVIGLYLEV